MFPLSNMLKSFIRTGTLTVIDAEGKTHKFGGSRCSGRAQRHDEADRPEALSRAVSSIPNCMQAKLTWTAA